MSKKIFIKAKRQDVIAQIGSLNNVDLEKFKATFIGLIS
jgi:hypothetical protein